MYKSDFKSLYNYIKHLFLQHFITEIRKNELTFKKTGALNALLFFIV